MQEQRPSSNPRGVLKVIEHLQQLILRGALQPGDQLPAEREFAKQLGMSRGSTRIGIGYLVGMGMLEVRSGVGTFLSDRGPHRKSPSLQLLACMYHFGEAQMLEAGMIVLEAAAGLAAERRSKHHVGEMAEELTEIYSSMDCAEDFLAHEMRFHRLVAESSGNPVFVAMMDMIAAIAFSNPSSMMQTQQQMRAVADRYREIYKAIRAGRRMNREAAISGGDGGFGVV